MGGSGRGVDGAARHRGVGAGALVRRARGDDSGARERAAGHASRRADCAEALSEGQEGRRHGPAARPFEQPRRRRASPGRARAHGGGRPRVGRFLLLRGGRPGRPVARAGQPRRDALSVDRVVEHERRDRGRGWRGSSIACCSSLSGVRVSELAVELADALPRLSRDGTGLEGTDLEAFEARSSAFAARGGALGDGGAAHPSGPRRRGRKGLAHDARAPLRRGAARRAAGARGARGRKDHEAPGPPASGP